MDDFLTVNQVSIILKVHPLTIRRYISQGKLKAIKLGGNVRISQDNLKNFSQNYTPHLNHKTQPTRVVTSTPFSSTDPLMRLKGRGISVDKF